MNDFNSFLSDTVEQFKHQQEDEHRAMILAFAASQNLSEALLNKTFEERLDDARRKIRYDRIREEAEKRETARLEREAVNLDTLVQQGRASARAKFQARQAPTTPSKPAPAAPAVAESWHIKEPERFHGYTLELYRVLKAAHDAGKPRPNARDVLDSWEASKPPNILEVMTDEFKYLDSSGNVKPTSIKALKTAISRMTSAR